MMEFLKKLGIYAAVQAGLTVAIRFAAKLIDDAWVSWLNDQIAKAFNIPSPTVSTVTSWAAPFVIAAVTLWFFSEYLWNKWKAQNANVALDKLPITKKYITLVEFIDEAGKTGWDITGMTNLHILDLMYGIRQAAHDGEISLRGRLDPNGAGKLSGFKIRTPITREHWVNYEINWYPEEENWRIGTINIFALNRCKENRYLDLDLESSTALKWLIEKSFSYKGWNETKNKILRDTNF